MTLTGPNGFGAAGTVTIDGVAFPAAAVDWSAGSITVRMSDQTSSLANPWGSKLVVFTPTDSSIVPLSYNFNCAVSSTVTTTINGGTAAVTIAAGTAYTAGASLVNPLPGTTYTPAATNGYQWVTAADHDSYGWNRNVQNGLPVAAGDYYVRVNIGQGTYDQVKYSRLWWENDSVRLTITGTAVTFTPKLASGAGTEITYKGQLGDGTGQTSTDIAYTKTATTDAVTTIYWEYKNTTCAGNDNIGWNSGLPSSVAIAPSNCGGDNTSVSSWDIRVRGFDMIVGGVNRNIYYIPTYNIFTLKINKKSLTISKVTAEKVYNGDANISLNEITVTGAVDGETPSLDGQNSQGTFSDATAGTGKTISLGGALTLAGGFNTNYVLSNPNIVFTGTIKKADASLRLTPSVSSVIMTNNAPVDITVTNRDTRTNQAPAVEAGVAAIVVTSATTSVCTYAAGVVTILKAGDCVINGSQAASANYNAAKSYQDDTQTVESITIKVFAAPKSVQVVAEDVSVALGESISPSATAIGLIEGDELGSVTYDYYQGATLLTSAPTEAGTYKIVPRDANITAADMQAYVSTFKYVAGKLLITQVPPVFTAAKPAHGPEAGNNTVVISGERLGDVTSIVIGTKTLRKSDFVVNGDGTEISFKAPAGKGQVDLILRAGNAESAGVYVYDAPAVPVVTAPVTLELKLNLISAAKLSGQKITLSGGSLKPLTEFTLMLGSISMFKGMTDANGNFSKVVTMPAKSCVAAGEHSLTLSGTKPNGSKSTAKASFSIGNQCVVGGPAAVKSVVRGAVTWTLSGFLFKYRDDRLTPAGLKSLDSLIKNIKGAKIVKIYGYTETDTKSAAVKKGNLVLAKARTESVRKYLLSKGINAKFFTYGKGGVNPVSLTNQAQNRRVVIDASF
jgi:outer membrane protein OmpA-like peptidoglycan-associated protein